MKRTLTVAGLFAGVLLVAAAATAQVTMSTITGTTEFNPANGAGTFDNGGVQFCAPEPCSPGSRLMVRGMKITVPMQSDDPRAVGPISLTINANYQPDFTGEEWGTFSHALAVGGSVEGVFRGKRTFENGQFKLTILGIGQGVGGPLDGSILRFTLVDTFTSMSTFTGVFEGVLIELPRRQ